MIPSLHMYITIDTHRPHWLHGHFDGRFIVGAAHRSAGMADMKGHSLDNVNGCGYGQYWPLVGDKASDTLALRWSFSLYCTSLQYYWSRRNIIAL
ncbi:hypothetical protein NPIL_696651 [Nephila pilipes]|uniref:Uncharacterized protein n=1 Tax=Nephila pilipes TaxID=299642 RepID=A0A8X6N7N4_NEPPI|nr:hypothetical protein NPIL_696651 [Nephila pilipes]